MPLSPCLLPLVPHCGHLLRIELELVSGLDLGVCVMCVCNVCVFISGVLEDAFLL